MNTVTSIRIDSELLEKIKTYSEIENSSQTDFINELLSDGYKKYMLLRSGGAVFSLPNPQNFAIDAGKAKEVLSILSAAAVSIHNLNANFPIPLFAILAYYEQRIINELPEDVETFRQNLILDSTRSERIANYTNSVGKED